MKGLKGIGPLALMVTLAFAACGGEDPTGGGDEARSGASADAGQSGDRRPGAGNGGEPEGRGGAPASAGEMAVPGAGNDSSSAGDATGGGGLGAGGLGSDAVQVPPSCVNLEPICGPASDGDCCESFLVPGGNFTLGRVAGAADDAACQTPGCGDDEVGVPASVSDFVLDRYPVTVARFREFIKAGSPTPELGAGKHVHLNDGEGIEGETGWQEDWNTSSYEIDTATLPSIELPTWTTAPADNEGRPITGITWYEAYAFCIWDGGFLPTEAEWEYAASGGEERVYPWSSPPESLHVSPVMAAYGRATGNSTEMVLAFVGTHSAGDGRFGHSDFAGQVFEWTLDGYRSQYDECHDCSPAAVDEIRSLRGGVDGKASSDGLSPGAARAVQRSHFAASMRFTAGVRCARPPGTERPSASPSIPGPSVEVGDFQVTPGSANPSCQNLAATCGPNADQSCCSSRVIPGGSFLLKDNFHHSPANGQASVSDFRLDDYEVTVGRFRKYASIMQRNTVKAGQGKNPSNPADTGWDSAWDTKYLGGRGTMLNQIKHCDYGPGTWTDVAGDNETLPMTCLSWFHAFAFCAWDGGRLPTEAEWYYAATGGAQQRALPWSVPSNALLIDHSYVCTGYACPVGGRSPKGDTRWGQADFASGAFEWVLDAKGYGFYPNCNDCGSRGNDDAEKMYRGGVEVQGDYPGIALRKSYYPIFSEPNMGVRCARAP